jgi:hypothetical protein
MSGVLEDTQKYAPVLQRAVEILGATDENVKFGEALSRASHELSLPIPEHMEGPLLSVLFRIFGSGKIPGLPDA